jgi:hypothetical protein
MDSDAKRTVELTAAQIAFLCTALDYSERVIRDTSYDPQVEEWARRHPSDPGETIAAIREALAKGSSANEKP